jgi:hypothetical protein
VNTTELFLKTIDAYKAWLKTGKDFCCYSDLYESWDKALLAYAESMNLSRSDAATHIYVAVKKDLI